MAADAVGGLLGAAGQSVGGLLKLGLDVGKVNRRPNPFYDPTGERGTGYNSDSFEYGGYKNGRRDYNATLNTRRNEVEGRQAFQANYDQANADRAAGQQARAGAMGMANAIAARARGETPSIAQMQADRQMGQAVAAQNAQVASARGGASVALAQQNAANNVAGAQSAISNQAQINAAQERERAEANAVGAYQGIRQGDQSAEGLAGQRSQFNTQMQQHNRDANDSRAMGYENLEARSNESALNAKMQEQQMLAQAHAAEEARQQAQAQHNANAEKSIWDDIIPSDANAKVPLQMPGGMMVSDMVGKVPTIGLGARLPPSQPSPMATTTFDRLTPDGGSMDVLGSLKAHSDFATRYANDAGSGPAAGGFMSDTRAKKTALLAQGRREGLALARRGGPSTQEMLDDRFQQINAGRGSPADTMSQGDLNSQIEAQLANDRIDSDLEAQKAEDERRSRDPAVGLGRAPKGYAKMRAAQMGGDEPDSKYAGMAPGQEDFDRTEPKQAKSPWWVSDTATDLLGFKSDARAKRQAFQDGAAYATKHITGEEMQPWNDEDDEGEDVPPRGPNPLPDPPPAPRAMQSFERQNPIAEANRSMAGSPYAYKDGLTPPSQKPGEPNFGPMAQNMEKSPIAGTAVKVEPTTGLKVIDRDKALKVVMSGVADLQRQQDQTRATMNRLQVGARRKR